MTNDKSKRYSPSAHTDFVSVRRTQQDISPKEQSNFYWKRPEHCKGMLIVGNLTDKEIRNGLARIVFG